MFGWGGRLQGDHGAVTVVLRVDGVLRESTTNCCSSLESDSNFVFVATQTGILPFSRYVGHLIRVDPNYLGALWDVRKQFPQDELRQASRISLRKKRDEHPSGLKQSSCTAQLPSMLPWKNGENKSIPNTEWKAELFQDVAEPARRGQPINYNTKNKLERTSAGHLLADPAPGSLGDVDREDGVASVGFFVEVVLSGRAHQLAPVQKVQGFLLGLYLGNRRSYDRCYCFFRGRALIGRVFAAARS